MSAPEAVDFLRRIDGHAASVGVSTGDFGLLETAAGIVQAVQLLADSACFTIGDASLVLDASLLERARVVREGLATVLVVSVAGDVRVTIYPEEPLPPDDDKAQRRT